MVEHQEDAGASSAAIMDVDSTTNVADITGDGGVTKRILTEGKGTATPPTGAQVHVHYVGTLASGENKGDKFDSSRDRNQPFQFKLGQGSVIKGWDRGVATMRKGEKCILTCRADYAYGESGSPPKIPGGATLDFEVELLDWKVGEDVTDDGLVTKVETREGTGYKKPKKGDRVLIRYSVKDAADNEVEKVDHYLFRLGEDSTVPAAVQTAITKMKVGEAADIVLRGHHVPAQRAAGAPGEEARCVYAVDLESWYEQEDVSGDGGIVKEITEQSKEWSKPTDSAVVTLSLRGYAANDANKRPFVDLADVEYKIGDESADIPEAVEEALTTMKQGESATVTVRAPYTASRRPPNAPENIDLAYDVTLTSFVKAKDTWEMNAQEKLEYADRLKGRGTSSFKRNEFGRAYKFYDKAKKAIEYGIDDEADKSRATTLSVALLLNMAMCKTKTEEWVLVRQHCDKALENDKDNVKGLYRRAHALRHLQEFDAAKADLARALSLEPSNATVRQELVAVQAEMKKAAAKEKKLLGTIFKKMFVERADEPAAQQNGSSEPAAEGVQPAAAEEVSASAADGSA